MILQIQKTKTAEGLKKVIEAFKIRYEAGQVDNLEFEEVNEEIQKTAKRLKIKI